METFDRIKDAFSGLKDALGDLWEAMAPTGSALRELANGILGVGKAIMGLFGDWTEEGKSFGESLGNIVVGVIEGFTTLAKAVKPIFAIIGNALSGLLDMLGTFIDLTNSAFDAFIGFTKSAISGVRDSWIGRKLFGGEDEDESESEQGQPTIAQGQPTIAQGQPTIAQVTNGAYASGMYHAPSSAILPPQTHNQSRRTDINIDRIEITTPDGDPETIAASVGDHLNNMLHNTAENFDDDFAR